MRTGWIIAAIAIAIFSNLLYPSTDKSIMGFTNKLKNNSRLNQNSIAI